MNNYIIHVIDNASNFQNIDGVFQIRGSSFQDENDCDILVSDAFYHIQAESPENAAANLSRIIMVKVNGEKISLAKALLDTKKSLTVADFDSKKPDHILSDITFEKKQNLYSNYIVVTCHIENEVNEEIIEVHRIEFFIIEENKIIDVL